MFAVLFPMPGYFFVGPQLVLLALIAALCLFLAGQSLVRRLRVRAAYPARQVIGALVLAVGFALFAKQAYAVAIPCDSVCQACIDYGFPEGVCAWLR